MKIIDRYIIRYFLLNFVILCFVLMALFCLVDLILQLDEFIAGARRLQGRFGGMAFSLPWVVADWFGPLLLLLYVFVSGLLVMGGMGFTLAGLTRSRELVAMLTGGVSMYRIAAPIIVTAAGLSAVALPVQEFAIPRLAHKLARPHSQVGSEDVRTFAVRFSPDTAGNLVTAANFDPRRCQLTDVTILVDRLADVRGRITATKAVWDPAAAGWRLEDGAMVRLSLAADPEGGLPVQHKQPWAFFKTDLSPEVLLARRAPIYLRLTSLDDLSALLENPAADHAGVLKAMHGRFSLLVVNVLILVMVLPFFLLREPANMLLQGVKAAAVGLGAWGAALLMMEGGVPMMVSGLSALATSKWGLALAVMASLAVALAVHDLSRKVLRLAAGPVRSVIVGLLCLAGLTLGPWLLGQAGQALGPTLSSPVTSAWLPVVLYLPAAAAMLMRVKT